MRVENQDTLYIDGQCQVADSNLLESLRPGVLKAKGVFETMRAENVQIFAIDDHLDRFQRGFKKLKIPWKKTKQETLKLVKSVLLKSDVKKARIRLSVWQKNGNVHYAVLIQPLTRPKKSFKVMISSLKRKQSELSRFKTLDYQVFYKAFEQAQAKGFDEAILLNTKGNIVEGARTSVFMVKDGQLWTPSLKSGCLEGIARRYVLISARKLKIPCYEKSMTVEDLKHSDYVFVTNALMGLISVVEINQAALNQKKGVLIFKRILQKYNFLLSKTLK